MSGKLYFLEVFFTKRLPPDVCSFFFFGCESSLKLFKLVKSQFCELNRWHKDSRYCRYILDYAQHTSFYLVVMHNFLKFKILNISKNSYFLFCPRSLIILFVKKILIVNQARESSPPIINCSPSSFS